MTDYSLNGVQLPPNVTPRDITNHMKDLRGRTFGRLTVIDLYGTHVKFRRTYWVCRCECGTVSIVAALKLEHGHTQSCGCLWYDAITTHQMSDTPEYQTWKSMKQRCLNPNSTKYDLYGGRGIRVCTRWRDSFEAFLEDVGPRPSSNHSIDRVDADADYEPSNTRWATIAEQNDNLRTARQIAFRGETHSLGWWARTRGINYKTLQRRFEMGWSTEDALTKPVDESYAHNKS